MDRASRDHDPEQWTELHEELTVLPETFRTPLVLCYLEGLTQEQAASQLHCPLGTIQSRLARGRAKLKSRLLRRGITPAAGFLGTETMAPEQAARASWVEETARAAVEFSKSWCTDPGLGRRVARRGPGRQVPARYGACQAQDRTGGRTGRGHRHARSRERGDGRLGSG